MIFAIKNKRAKVVVRYDIVREITVHNSNGNSATATEMVILTGVVEVVEEKSCCG